MTAHAIHLMVNNTGVLFSASWPGVLEIAVIFFLLRWGFSKCKEGGE